MPQPPDGPADAAAYPAVCDHTHLFPGARCRVRGLPDPGAFAADPSPAELVLRFSDDVVTEAEVRTADPAGPVLAVPAYTTGAGTTVDGRTWLIRGLARTGDAVELIIGGHAPA